MAEQAGRKTVLLVDDDRDIMATMTAALGELDVQIIAAGDGDEALVQADRHHPHVVVLDISMPKRSGFLVMEKLKRGKHGTDPPRIVMITGNPGARHKAYAESHGVEGYLTKPFRMEKLVESVKKLLS